MRTPTRIVSYFGFGTHCTSSIGCDEGAKQSFHETALFWSTLPHNAVPADVGRRAPEVGLYEVAPKNARKAE
jgi:hypothetical protein